MHLWLNQHLHALSLVAQRLRQQWFNTLTICLVIGMTATLPGALFVTLDNLQSVSAHLKQDAQISVFLKTEVSSALVQRLMNDIEQLPGVKTVEFVSRDEAWSQLGTQFSGKAMLADLPKNPLPDALFITLADTQPAHLKPIQEALQQRAEVDELVIDTAWISRLHHMLNLGKQVSLLFAALLATTMLTVISNTVRMQVLTHQAEIEVSRLIGASHGFIRRPYLYMGSVYGIGGGLLALALLYGVLAALQAPVQLLAGQYQTSFTLSLPLLKVGGSLLACTWLTGFTAAWLAVRKTA